MEERNPERIKFSIKGPEGVYHGEAIGDDLRSDAVFQVRLSNGEQFQVKAKEMSDYPERYNWFGYAQDRLKNLVPVVGGIIERYFRRKNNSTQPT